MYKVTIFDSNKHANHTLKEIIDQVDGFHVIAEASNGNEALEILRVQRPHLAFIDLQLPDISGLELLQIIFKENLPTMVVIISHHAEFAYVQKALLYSAIGYCLKPYSKNDVLEYFEKTKYLLENAVINSWRVNSYHTGNEFVDKMLDYINANYKQDISVQELAALCHINYNYAGQLFRQETGETINKFLMRIRMDKASDLLKNTAMSIADVATETGYKDYFYFAKIFKKHWGITPSEYRTENA